MKPTEQLKNEHKAIKLMTRILGKVCDKLEAKEKVESGHLKGIVEFIRVFADKCHHSKEEDLLFPAIEESGIPREGGPTGVMFEEHEAGRRYVGALADAVEKYEEGDTEITSKIVENARSYISLLSQHIDKEDNILYEIADMHLSDEKQEELLAGFEKIENERIGKGKHEEFHKFLEELQVIYE